MKPQATINTAVARCPVLRLKSLELFLGDLLDEDLETLAQMPGTPGQVMAAQFTYYVRRSVDLTETCRRHSEQFSMLIECIMRMPADRRRATTNTQPRREAPDGTDSSHSRISAA